MTDSDEESEKQILANMKKCEEEFKQSDEGKQIHVEVEVEV